MKKYIVTTKSDDYGACLTELVETTPEKAKEYYHHKEVNDSDALVLYKYFDLVGSKEELERSDERRYYGQE